MKITYANMKHIGKNIRKPIQELPRLTLAVAGNAVKQQVSHTKEYLAHATRHLKMLPKIRSLEDATHFATEAGNRSIAYAKKTLAVLQEGATQYQGWAKKTAKALGLKIVAKTTGNAKKKTASYKQPKRTSMRRAEEKQEKQAAA